jgi:hypothetical protein
MNVSLASKSKKPRKSRTRPEGRRTFTPVVDRLDQRISLSSVSPTGSSGHFMTCGLTSNHNETLVHARTPRNRKSASRKDRRPLVPAVEGLERRISLSTIGLTGSITQGAGGIRPCGTTLNHNETLVPAPRRRRR